MGLVVGSQAGQDVQLLSEKVSREHAQVLVDAEGQVFVVDRRSTNGTFVNGLRLEAGKLCRVLEGDRVCFGEDHGPRLEVRVDVKMGNAGVPEMGESLMGKLRVKGLLNIGRHADCDVVLEGEGVSRLHATLKLLEDGAVLLTDLGSTNGTFLNGKRVHGSVKVGSDDVILIGRVRLGLDAGPKNLSGEVAIRTEGITKRFGNGKVGLNPTTIAVEAGSLLAIMGPSGCGKSTLMKCLTGESPATGGRVYLHELELVQHYEFLKPLIGYVPQDDVVHKELRVEQALYYAAKLRMEKPSGQRVREKIAEVTRRLRIDDILQSPIGKISGGQRKRVSIAVELLTDPLILFLDEPTSPLDPQSIAEFMQILKDLARSGTTVVLVTHKPDDLTFMDSVVFMARGGHVAYHGSVQGYKGYFGVQHAVEVYAVLSGAGAAGWSERFLDGVGQVGTVRGGGGSRLKKRARGTWVVQVWWLCLRYLQIKVNDWLNILLLLGQAPLIALLVCLIFDQVTVAVPFLAVLSAAWLGTSNAAREIVGERGIYRRERMYNLRIGAYLFSKVAILSVFGGIQAASFAGIVVWHFSIGDAQWQDFTGTALWLWLITVVSSMLGLLLSAFANTVEKVMTLVPLVLIPQVMLAGVVTPLKNNVVELMSYLTPTRWGNDGLVVLQGGVLVEGTDCMDPYGGPVRTVMTAENVLGPQYGPLYQHWFGEAAHTLRLDGAALGVLGVMLLAMVWGVLYWKEAKRE